MKTLAIIILLLGATKCYSQTATIFYPVYYPQNCDSATFSQDSILAASVQTTLNATAGKSWASLTTAQQSHYLELALFLLGILTPQQTMDSVKFSKPKEVV